MSAQALERLEELASIETGRRNSALAAIARAKEIGIEAEAVVAARYDIATFWMPKIIRAVEQRKAKVTNRGWNGQGRADAPYIKALQDELNTPFCVSKDETMMFGPWTQIFW